MTNSTARELEPLDADPWGSYWDLMEQHFHTAVDFLEEDWVAENYKPLADALERIERLRAALNARVEMDRAQGRRRRHRFDWVAGARG